MSNPSAKISLRRRPFAFTEQGVAMLASPAAPGDAQDSTQGATARVRAPVVVLVRRRHRCSTRCRATAPRRLPDRAAWRPSERPLDHRGAFRAGQRRGTRRQRAAGDSATVATRQQQRAKPRGRGRGGGQSRAEIGLRGVRFTCLSSRRPRPAEREADSCPRQRTVAAVRHRGDGRPGTRPSPLAEVLGRFWQRLQRRAGLGAVDRCADGQVGRKGPSTRKHNCSARTRWSSSVRFSFRFAEFKSGNSACPDHRVRIRPYLDAGLPQIASVQDGNVIRLSAEPLRSVLDRLVLGAGNGKPRHIVGLGGRKKLANSTPAPGEYHGIDAGTRRYSNSSSAIGSVPSSTPGPDPGQVTRRIER